MIIPNRCLLAAALTASVVSGHGWLSKPAATFPASAGDKSQFIGTIDSSKLGWAGEFGGPPADNVAAFTKAFKASKYKTIKALVDDKTDITVTGATLTCGIADPKAAAQPLPAELEWSHSDSEGFTASHEGPCEAWCDDTKVFSDENCAADFKTAPAKMPYEKSSCTGASMLTFYWLAMHGPQWQVYVDCAPLSGSGGGGTTATSSASSSTADTPTVTSATQQTTPSATTAPSTSTGSGSSPSTSTGSSTGSSAGSTPSATTAPSSGSTPTVTSAPSTGSTASATSPPSTSSGESSDCGSYDVAGSASDCGSYDVAGSASDCGSYDVAGGESDCGSYDVAGGESDCSSYDVAGSGTDTSSGTTTQGSATGGTDQNSWGTTTTQGSSTGGTNQYYSGTWGATNQGSGTQTTQQYTGSKTNIGFNTIQNQNWSAGTVAPQ